MKFLLRHFVYETEAENFGQILVEFLNWQLLGSFFIMKRLWIQIFLVLALLSFFRYFKSTYVPKPAPYGGTKLLNFPYLLCFQLRSAKILSLYSLVGGQY